LSFREQEEEDNASLSGEETCKKRKEQDERTKCRKAFRNISTRHIDDFIDRKLAKNKLKVTHWSDKQIKHRKLITMIVDYESCSSKTKKFFRKLR
jgi:hypothetical protein